MQWIVETELWTEKIDSNFDCELKKAKAKGLKPLKSSSSSLHKNSPSPKSSSKAKGEQG